MKKLLTLTLVILLIGCTKSNNSESLYNTNSPCFEYLLIITWDKNYQVEYLIQYTWEQFVEYRRMKNPEKKYFSPPNEKIIGDGLIIYSKYRIN